MLVENNGIRIFSVYVFHKVIIFGIKQNEVNVPELLFFVHISQIVVFSIAVSRPVL
jgi:hypothetical protein